MSMVAEKYAETLKNVFKRHRQIAFAYLFGSMASGEQTALSDVDIAVYHYRDARFSFDDTLQFQGDCCRVLQRNDVDVLVLNTSENLILLDNVIRNGRIIYNMAPQLLNDFELKTLHLACDFKYQRRREMGV